MRERRGIWPGVRTVEFALYSRPVMSGDEVALYLDLRPCGPRVESFKVTLTGPCIARRRNTEE